MKKLLFISILLLFTSTAKVDALAVEAAPATLKTSPILITGYQSYGSGFDFIQIYNNSSQMVLLDGWALGLEITDDTGSTTDVKVQLKNWLPGNEYAIIAENGTVEGADLKYPGQTAIGKITELKIIPPPGEFAVYATKDALFTPGRYAMEPTTAGNFTASRPFILAGDDAPLYGGGLYAPHKNTGLRIVEILANPRHCSPQETSVDLACNNYIKLFNPTNKPIILDFYRLRVGWGNDNPGINNSFSLSGTLQPGAYFAVAVRDDGEPVNITASGGYAWVEDIYGITQYSNTTYKYPSLSGETYRGFSWALDNTGQWRWAVPAPNTVNDFSGQPSPKTTSTNLKPCKPGQTRNPDTNRCRNVTTAASTLKPCKPGQVRNPSTNRCRSTTSSSSLKPCDPNQERNPETNRCRKVAGASTDLPSIQDIQSTPGGRNYRWWIVGSIAGGAVVFGVWEWRRDIANWLTRFKKSNGSPPS